MALTVRLRSNATSSLVPPLVTLDLFYIIKCTIIISFHFISIIPLPSTNLTTLPCTHFRSISLCMTIKLRWHHVSVFRHPLCLVVFREAVTEERIPSSFTLPLLVVLYNTSRNSESVVYLSRGETS